MSKIKVVMLEPGKFARTEVIDTYLASLQETVGGLIEAYYPFEEEVCIVCNDEGKIMQLPLNRAVRDENGDILDIIAGTAFICDCSGEEFGSLSEEQLERYTKLFYHPQMFFSDGDNIQAVNYNPDD